MRWFLLALSIGLGFCTNKQDQVFRKLPADATGLNFNNLIEEDDQHNVFQYMNIYTGAGVAAGDINNDGLMDLYFSGNMVTGRLFLNKGGLKFEDITETSGLTTKRWCTGAAMVDINQDGWTDLYVTVSGSAAESERGNLLYVNNGDNSFTEQASQFGIDDQRQAMHSAFLDYDLDGDLDLFLLINPAAYEHNVNVVQPRKLAGESISTDALYRNNGDGTFTDVSDSAGILIEGYGLGVAVSDINMDGWPDIYISNDFIGNDVLYINNSDGTFTNRAADFLKHTSYAGMGNDVSDFNNDGLVDIMVLDMRPEDNIRQKLIISSHSYDQFQLMLESGYEPQYGRNTLQLNQGGGNFSEIGFLSGVSSTDWSWSALFGDYDNDGDRDLFVTNGFMRDLGDLDYIHYQQVYNNNAFGQVEAKKDIKREAIKSLPGASIRDYLFENNGGLTFTDRSIEWGITKPGFSHGAVYVDLDNDGDLELVVNNVNEQAHVYENRSDQLFKRNFIRIDLDGTLPNREGLGAKLWVSTKNGIQYYEHYLFRGYESSVDPVIHFGLDTIEVIDQIRIEWPDGKSQILENVAVNQLLTISHTKAGQPLRKSVATSQPAFVEVTDSLGVYYQHQEDDYVDFKSQPIIPHMHSKGGPSIAIGDINGDGLEDFHVGGATGFPGYIYLQQPDGTFKGQSFDHDIRSEDMGSLLFDADLDGDLDLYVVSGGTSFEVNSVHYQDRLYLNDGSGGFTRAQNALPAITASGSGVTAGDYDGDGDLDLFVGGRIIPQQYPMPARSYILRNNTQAGAGSGPVSFTDVTDEIGNGLSAPGLVTTALWTDYDNDNRLDLIVTGEFMPLRFFHNEQGHLIERTESAGLTANSGWWNSLVAADFDGDGDTDYAGGNLGLNSRYRASAEEPLCIYASDFDKDGRLDPVMCYYIQGENYIAHSRNEIIAQISAMRGRFKTYKDYANVNFEESFLKSELASAHIVVSNNFENSYIENLGGGKFSIRPLPVEAQVAPIYGMTALDYNQDGHCDLLAVGNSYATEVATGRYDASIGLCLMGDGKGNFKSVPWEETGFLVDGDAKGLAQLQAADGHRLLIATANSGRLKIHRFNADHKHNFIPGPTDALILINLKNGSTVKMELYHGSSYLSQSSRSVRITPDMEKVEIISYNGDRRLLDLSAVLQ